MFSSVGVEEFVQYEQRHTRLITVLVMPLMLAEVGLAAALAHSPPTAVETGAAPPWATSAGVALLGLIWGSTALLQMPCHVSLSGGFDSEEHDWLVLTNWVRTAAWSARGVLSMWMLCPADLGGASTRPQRNSARGRAPQQ